MKHYCTLFDSNYLTRGLALYNSLSKHEPDFTLYVFCFDQQSLDTLKLLQLEKLVPISLAEFEDDELKSVKPHRSAGEYCWTCTPSTILYVLDKFDVSECTYLDADLYFLNRPSLLIEEMGDADILLTEHRYSAEYDQSKLSGIYCVQFMTFRNTDNGLKALSWWRDACIDWCYNRIEDGKFGDQKYLDDWTTRFDGVHVLEHLGGGIAPWNCQQYEALTSQRFVKREGGSEFDGVFYHFHACKFLDNDCLDAGDGYTFPKSILRKLYSAYGREILSVEMMLKTANVATDFPYRTPAPTGIRGYISKMKRILKRTNNLQVMT